MPRAALKRSTASQTQIVETPPRTAEDRAIYRALQILDQRMRKRCEVVSSPQSAATIMRLRLARLKSEHFVCLFLDTQHRVIAFEILARGTIDGAAVYPREVVRRALELNAAAVILGHNHPSGIAEPSAADRVLTERLRQALGLIDVRVLDHLVIGDGMPVSFAERGWI